MSKGTAVKISCGSYDQLDPQSLNNYIFFCFAIEISNILGHVKKIN